jgi:hypothetical protein
MSVRVGACVGVIALAIVAVAWASAAGHGESGRAAAPATTSAAGCTSAAASQAATAAGFDVDPGLHRTPINSVICGPFFGAGSEGMAAIVPVPAGCGFSIGWGVFRLVGSAWQLVMQQHNGVLKLESQARADGGADIRTTQGYPRRYDAPCSPSRMRSRVWHWNGTAFVASAWTVQLLSVDFFTPKPLSAYCGMTDSPTAHVVDCTAFKPPHAVDMNGNGRFKACHGIGQHCINCGCSPPDARPLKYGQHVDVGRFRCESLHAGVRCTVTKTGKGFLLTRTTTVRVG